jgi:hypothetical protein
MNAREFTRPSGRVGSLWGRSGRRLRVRQGASAAGVGLGWLLTAVLPCACSASSGTLAQSTTDASMTADSPVTQDSGSMTGDAASGDAASGDSGSTDAGPVANPIVSACTVPEGGALTLSFSNHTYAGDPRLLRTDEALFSGVNTLDDPYTQIMRLHNGGTSSASIISVGIAPQATLFPVAYRQTSNPTAFKATVLASSDAGTDAATGALPLPATIAAGGDLDVEVQFLSTNTNPPTRYDNTGGDAVAALLVAESTAGCVQAGLYGVGLWNDSESIDGGVPSSNYGRFEPTLGQIIATLGYRVDVGVLLQTFLNVNQVSAFAMDPPPLGDTPSDEVIVHDFVLADTSKPAVLLAPARFAPKFDFPYGWFAAGSTDAGAAQPDAGAEPPTASPPGLPVGLQWVATMDSVVGTDNYTSDHSEMVLPPISGNAEGTFAPIPATASFGLWCFGNQRSSGSAPLNGDYVYSQDELNIVTQTGNPPLPADLVEAGVNHGFTTPVHRYRVWPLKDRAGNPVANSYLIALEEATNDDYQDMIFTLSNVQPAP